MSRSHKARYGTGTREWKDSVGASRSQSRARAGWKRLSSRSLRRKGQQQEGRERTGVDRRAPQDRKRGVEPKEGT